LTRSGTGSASVRLCRQGWGWQGTRPRLTHDAADELGGAGLAPADQMGVDAPVAVGLL
jgi:hypothetical protein